MVPTKLPDYSQLALHLLKKITRRYMGGRMERDRVLRCAFFLLLVGLMTRLPLRAQKITGDISGTVQDTTGAVVKDAKVTATNVATGEVRSAATSDGGFYRILEMPPGNYKVTATAPGFKTSVRDVQVAISMVTQ